MRTRYKAVPALYVFLAAGAALAQAQAPQIDAADDAQFMPKKDNVLFWTPAEQVSGYRNMDKIAPTRVIKASATPYPLPAKLADIGSVSFAHGVAEMSVDEYFASQNVAGLIVVKNGNVIYERYGLGNTAATPWVSFSVAKSVVSMLVGAAIKDGYINNVDEKVTDYLPRLKGTSYDQATIKDILQMASGVAWNEDYGDPNSDVARATYESVALYSYLGSKPRDHAPGEVFNYNTGETNLVGTLLRSAIGNNLATYLSAKIWQPFGMEHDASWNLTEPGGGEFGGCCINASLRDYARLGLFAMRDGRLPDGSSSLPTGWMKASTTPSQGYAGYGYLWWLVGDGVYRASGIFGQGIYINPSANVVIAMHSARSAASTADDKDLQAIMFDAVVESLR